MNNYEIVAEIITIASILIKFEREDILEKRDEFIAFCNEAGVKNENGRQLNSSNFRKLIQSLTDEDKKNLLKDFNEGFEGVYRHLEMYTNK